MKGKTTPSKGDGVRRLTPSSFRCRFSGSPSSAAHRHRYLFKVMKTILIIIFLFSLICCHSDVVTSRYTTYQEAIADNIFQRGWLPANIPDSSSNFVLNNNLDLNTSVGEFTIDTKTSKEFIEKLKSIDEGKNVYKQYQYSNGNSLWIFHINPKNGHVKYTLKQITSK